MAEPTFRLPRGGFEQIGRILRAYLSASKGSPSVGVKLHDVARRAAMNPTIVSGNNAFLASLGLIEGGNTKHLTELGVDAALTLDHPESPEAHRAWTTVAERSPDLDRVVDAVRIRQGMDEDALLSHIVLTAGVPKSAKSLTGARTIVDILEFAGVVEETDGTYRVRPPAETDGGTMDVRVPPSGSEGTVEGPTPIRTPARAIGEARVNLNVHVWVNASDADFEELADRLKQLLSELSDT
jgi:hypothetical protein